MSACTRGMFSHGPRDDILVTDGLHTQRRSRKGTTEPKNAYCLVTSQPSRGPRATRACGAAAGNKARARATAGAGRAMSTPRRDLPATRCSGPAPDVTRPGTVRVRNVFYLKEGGRSDTCYVRRGGTSRTLRWRDEPVTKDEDGVTALTRGPQDSRDPGGRQDEGSVVHGSVCSARRERSGDGLHDNVNACHTSELHL